MYLFDIGMRLIFVSINIVVVNVVGLFSGVQRNQGAPQVQANTINSDEKRKKQI